MLKDWFFFWFLIIISSLILCVVLIMNFCFVNNVKFLFLWGCYFIPDLLSFHRLHQDWMKLMVGNHGSYDFGNVKIKGSIINIHWGSNYRHKIWMTVVWYWEIEKIIINVYSISGAYHSYSSSILTRDRFFWFWSFLLLAICVYMCINCVIWIFVCRI